MMTSPGPVGPKRDPTRRAPRCSLQYHKRDRVARLPSQLLSTPGLLLPVSSAGLLLHTAAILLPGVTEGLWCEGGRAISSEMVGSGQLRATWASGLGRPT